MLPANGWVTAIAKPTATAASTALPPFCSTDTPTSAAIDSIATTMPCRARTGWRAADSGEIRKATTAKTAHERRVAGTRWRFIPAILYRPSPPSSRSAHNVLMTNDPDIRPIQDQMARLEQALIEEFIRRGGHDPAHLELLPPTEREALLKRASAYAAARLAEVEARAHYVHEIHGDR